MLLAYLVITAITIFVNAVAATADLTQTRFALANADEVRVARSWVPALGVLKGAGVGGLLLGLAGIHLLGIAAGAGLVAFFIGALVAHARARVFYNVAFPGAFLALALATLALAGPRWA